MRQEDALLVIVGWLRDRRPNPDGLTFFGYDIYIPNLIHSYLRRNQPHPDSLQNRVTPHNNRTEEDRLVDKLFPLFADAAWELCRRGIIRPGVHARLAQGTDEGNAGSGFSVTEFGRKWLQENSKIRLCQLSQSDMQNCCHHIEVASELAFTSGLSKQ
jgi:hypothetical protein